MNATRLILKLSKFSSQVDNFID